MKQRCFFVFFSLLCFGVTINTWAQKDIPPGQTIVDSLKKQLRHMQPDTNGVHLLNKLSIRYQYIQPDSGIKYGKQALELAEKLNFRRGIAWANLRIGDNYYNKVMHFYYRPLQSNSESEYSKIWEYYTIAATIFEEVADIRGKILVTGDIAALYLYQENYEKALQYNLKVLALNQALGDHEATYSVLAGIGNNYRTLHRYALAVSYYEKAIQLAERKKEQKRVIGFLRNLGDVYADSGDLKKAVEYYSLSLQMAETLPASYDSKAFSAIVAMNLSETYTDHKEYINALEYAQKALVLDESVDRKVGISSSLFTLGKNYLLLSELPAADYREMATLKPPKSGIALPSTQAQALILAISYLEKSLRYARENSLDNLAKLCFESLAAACKLKGDHATALKYFEQFVITKDTIESKSNKEKALKKMLQYEYALQASYVRKEQNKKDALVRLQIEREQDKRDAIIGIAGLLLLTSITALYAYRQKKQDNNTISIEKKKSDDLLLNILPQDVADELKTKGSAQTRTYDNVTVMLTDFADFTIAGERMTPQELVAELDSCFRAFDHIVTKYGIEKIKTIGDAYLAVGGLPKANANHAHDMVSAAIDIREYMTNRKMQIGNQTFEIRIGINSGPVVAGIVGVNKFAYDIWGDTVNTAARMEQNSERGKINVSGTTYQLIKDRFACVYRGKIDAKNKGALEMYFVENAL